MPESPRWLILKGRYGQAQETLEYMAEANRTDLPTDLDLEKINIFLQEVY